MTRPRIRRRNNKAGVAFLVILAVCSLVWLQGMEMRKLQEAFYYVQQTTKDIGLLMDIPPASRLLNNQTMIARGGDMMQRHQQPTPQQSSFNVTDAMINNVVQYETSSVCPELLAAATLAASSTTPTNYNIFMIQLLGVWRLRNARIIKDGTPEVRQQVYESNAKQLHANNIESMPLTRRPTTTSGLLTPNYWKIEAVMEACNGDSARDLVWFLDSDVVLTGDSVPIDILWHYHAEYARKAGIELSILFAKDWRGIYSGSFVVNCRSTSAMQFLLHWKEAAIQRLQPTFTLLKHTAFQEQDAAHELQALREVMQVTPSSAGVRTTVSPCAMATYELMLHCRARTNREEYLIEGPAWYEPGHWAVHISGDTKDRLRRNEYLLHHMPDNTTNVTTAAPSLSLVESGRNYLSTHQDKPSIDPAQQLNIKLCQKEEKAARKYARERMAALRHG